MFEKNRKKATVTSQFSLPFVQSALDGEFVNRNCVISQDRKVKYHFGIIDYLQDFTPLKKFETYYKRIFLRKQMKLISCMEPNDYRERFINDLLFNVLSPSRISPEIQLRCYLVPIYYLKNAIDLSNEGESDRKNTDEESKKLSSSQSQKESDGFSLKQKQTLGCNTGPIPI